MWVHIGIPAKNAVSVEGGDAIKIEALICRILEIEKELSVVSRWQLHSGSLRGLVGKRWPELPGTGKPLSVSEAGEPLVDAGRASCGCGASLT